LVLICTAGCQLARNTLSVTEIVQDNTSTRTRTFTPTQNLLPSLAASSTVPANILNYQCLEIASELPTSANPTGILALSGKQKYYYYFGKGLLQVMQANHYFYSVSPNRQWIAYEEKSSDSPTGSWLTVENVQGKRIRTIMQQNWIFPYWVNDNQLAFTIIDSLSSIRPVAIVEPSKNIVQIIPSDYPNLERTNLGPQGTSMHFDISSVVYESSTNLVIYSATTSQGIRLVLWDRQKGKAIASVPSGSALYNFPVWQQDGNRFYIPIADNHGNEDWYSINANGEMLQLTHFRDYFEGVDISEASLSPDGRKLAFWLETSPDISTNASAISIGSLSILNLDTLQVINYCLSGLYIEWSPDSRYLVFSQGNQVNNSLILVDPTSGWAARIKPTPDEYTLISGWMVSP